MPDEATPKCPTCDQIRPPDDDTKSFQSYQQGSSPVTRPFARQRYIPCSCHDDRHYLHTRFFLAYEEEEEAEAWISIRTSPMKLRWRIWYTLCLLWNFLRGRGDDLCEIVLYPPAMKSLHDITGEYLERVGYDRLDKEATGERE